jgi:GNAT superfamily N-acetyltransferase
VAIVVSALEPSQWRELRSLRLSALQDAPQAFGSGYEREAPWSEDEWRAEFEAATWLVAFDGEQAVGMLRSAWEDAQPEQRNIEGVWVTARFRRRGVCRLLFQALIERERQDGAAVLLAWVLDGNNSAHRVYLRLGFTPTDEQQLFPDGSGRFEHRLSYRISGGSNSR